MSPLWGTVGGGRGGHFSIVNQSPFYIQFSSLQLDLQDLEVVLGLQGQGQVRRDQLQRQAQQQGQVRREQQGQVQDLAQQLDLQDREQPHMVTLQQQQWGNTEENKQQQ